MLLLPAILTCMCMGANGWNIKSHLSTLTPYKYSVNGANVSYTVPDRCEPIYIDAVFRHGSRYPTSGSIKEIASLMEFVHKFNDSLKLPWMKTWENPFIAENNGRLSETGIQEHYDLGTRFVKRYKSLLSPYNPNRILFTSTYVNNTTHCTHALTFFFVFSHSHTHIKKTRTGQSGASFCDGMTGKTIPVALSTESKGMDRKLRFFDDCARYTKEIKKNPTTLAESEAYFALHKNEISQRISNVTGIPAVNLTTEILEGMWSACQSEVSVFDNAENWCSIFNSRDAEIFEYAYDLSAYYTKGYGHDINYLIASPLLSDIVSAIDMIALINTPNGGDIIVPRAQLRFGHAETVMPLLAILGLYKDNEKLTSKWNDADIIKRKWRTSNISSLATNVAFVLYMCNDNNATLDKRPYVEVLHDENIVYLPKCGNRRLCPLQLFKNIYNNELRSNWTETCKSGSFGRSPSWLVMVLAVFVMMIHIA